MKHLKNFNALSESMQDTTFIMDFLANSPEGSDLVRLNNDPRYQTFATMFEGKRTGRVYCNGFGSKTYIDKNQSGEYCWQTLSNGKIFAQECYPTLAECVRKLWSNILAKGLNRFGIKKSVLRNWAETNITVGSGLKQNELVERYAQSAGRKLADLSEISNSKMFNFLEAVFDATYQKYSTDPNNYILLIDLTRPFGINICNIPENTSNIYSSRRPRLDIHVKNDLSGKNRTKKNSADIENQIIIGDPDRMIEYFDTAVPKIIMKLATAQGAGYRFGIRGSVLCPELLLILENFFSSDNSQDSYSSVSNIIKNALVKMRDKPVLYSSVIKALQTSGKFPDIIDKFAEEDSDLIKGGSTLKNFGFDDED